MQGSTIIRVLIADDHMLVVDGLKSCLEIFDHIQIVGIAQTGTDALKQAERLSPDVILMDINMPELNGLDATELLKERSPDVKVLILSMHDNPQYIASAMQNGARGFVLKDVPFQEVVTAIEAVHRGGTYFSSGVSEILLSHKITPDESPLSTREQAVLLLLAEGNTNKHVARELDISIRTVETHRRNIKQKLDISSTAGLTRYAIENGLIKPGT